jgi:ATP-dependent Lon protease
MNPARIPLFPLDIVLFPGQAVPLHIFEPRYQQMTRHCIDAQSPFGIVHVSGVNLAQTGCSAMIVKILKEYEDGRSDILTAGQNAFRLVRTHDDKPYMEADVEYLEEDFIGVDSTVSSRLEQLCNQCHQILYGRCGRPPKPPGNSLGGRAPRATRRASCQMVSATAEAGTCTRESRRQRPRKVIEGSLCACE